MINDNLLTLEDVTWGCIQINYIGFEILKLISKYKLIDLKVIC